MVLPSASPIVLADSRGNRLLDYRVTKSNSDFFVNLRCVEGIAAHVWQMLDGMNCAEREPGANWTHCFRFDGPYLRSLHNALTLLATTLSVPFCSQLDHVLALDFYKVPPASPSDQWTNTDVGELIYRAKYWKSDPAEPKRSGAILAEKLANCIRLHPLLSDALSVVSVPGSSPDSFGEKLANSVAHRLKLPLVQSQLLNANAFGPAKAGHLPNLTRTYQVAPLAPDAKVIIIDDVYTSGTTMCGVADAARSAGATKVFGLVGARTHKK